jgi:hypothetical protein
MLILRSAQRCLRLSGSHRFSSSFKRYRAISRKYATCEHVFKHAGVPYRGLANKSIDENRGVKLLNDFYDLVIPELNYNSLRTAVAEQIGIEYLATAPADAVQEKGSLIAGILYGPFRRPVVPCVCRFGDKSKWVFFLIDALAPESYLSLDVSV